MTEVAGPYLNRTQGAYPELFAVLGGKVPGLRGRVLWGDVQPGKFTEAGLPNIMGVAATDQLTVEQVTAGAFYVSKSMHTGRDTATAARSSILGFDASRSSPVYGRSETVQPPAFTVRFLIRARP